MRLLSSKTPAVRDDRSSPHFTLTGKATFGGVLRAEFHIDRDCRLQRGDVLLLEVEIHPETGIAGLVVKERE